MNHIAEDIFSYYGAGHDPNHIVADMLMHYGMPRRSGRYPYGSGDDPYQHENMDFLGRVETLQKQGKTERDIAEALGIVNEKGEPSTSRLRAQVSYAKDERKLYQIATARRLKEKEGKGPTEIGKEMGVPESTVRGWLTEGSENKIVKARETADLLRNMIETKGMIDVGTGVERELGISSEKLNSALYVLESEGYPIYKGGIPQATNPGKQINQRVICPKGTEHKEIYNYDQIHTVNEYTSRDGGDTFVKFQYPASMDSKRLKIRYADDIGPDGARGVDKDGIIEIRRGVPDLSLGDSHYAQVRILVDDTRYIKGMAVYSDNMPDGVDVVFNTNKKSTVPKMDVLKKIKDDPDNPFGSLIKPNGQSEYIDKDGNKKLSLINKRADEGDWEEWKNALPSQFLGKQSLKMIHKQLDLAKADKYSEYEDICSLNNPTVKKHYLKKFAEECDSAAVHLQAAALPGQKYHVIIPINSLKDNEVYAPNYEPGTEVALIRYPHGGTFEIPILTVTHKNKHARSIIGTESIDAIGINKNIADRLSGADFDGDTVMVIPTNDKAGKVRITSTPKLKGLEGFDPKDAYQYEKMSVDKDGKEHYYDKDGREFKIMNNTGTQMGIVSNLITDMTLAGANSDELARAVRHSMVVIDAEKHKLDYKKSEIDNDIASLKKKYQVKIDADGNETYGGASTILSRAKGETTVLRRQGTPKINVKGTDHYDPTKPEGSLIYKVADDVEYTVKRENKRTGEIETVTKYKTQKSTNMMETDDAHTLVSPKKNEKEIAYADYANEMKALANKARLEYVQTEDIKMDRAAKDVYREEVESLDKKLNNALLNKTRERAAQRQTAYEVGVKKDTYYEQTGQKMKTGDVKKLNQQTLTSSRASVGSLTRKERNIVITDKEWEAIQAGAVSKSKLEKILDNSDPDKLRERAMPRQQSTLSDAKVAKIQRMSSSNYTLYEIADALGVSTSTVSKYLKGA